MSADLNAPTALDLDDEQYESAEDEDFQLDLAEDESELSSSEDETAEPAKKKRKPDRKDEIIADELDSGDEATIQKAQGKVKKKKGKGKDVTADDEDIDLDEDEETGTGGFVRTRAMRKHLHEEERKPLARIDGSTVDVDALWAQMNAPESQIGVKTSPTENEQEAALEEPDRTVDVSAANHKAPEPKVYSRHGPYREQMIKIKRTYKFAGEMITEEKVVPKDSAEAKAFLSSGENVEFAEVEDVDGTKDSRNLRRPLRRISRFDPNPSGVIKKSWEKQAITGTIDASGPKINTVEKSRLDWAQYVDQAGIKDELRTHSKAKEGYMGRMDFLGRMESKREEEARQARLRGI